jgi:hypothetical protein
MNGPRWLASAFLLVGLVLHLRQVDYFNFPIFAVFFIIGCVALGMSAARRPADRPALRVLGLGVFFPLGPRICAFALEAAGVDLHIARSLGTAERWLEITLRTAIVWIPLAVVVGLLFWRRAGATFGKPLSRALLALRVLDCVIAPSALVAIGSETGVGGVGISVFAPSFLLSWSAGRLAWEPAGDQRRVLLRRYGRLFAIVAMTILVFIAAYLFGLVEYDRLFETYFRNPNWRLLSFSEMGVPFTLLALFYLVMSVWLSRESRERSGHPSAATDTKGDPVATLDPGK